MVDAYHTVLRKTNRPAKVRIFLRSYFSGVRDASSILFLYPAPKTEQFRTLEYALLG